MVNLLIIIKTNPMKVRQLIISLPLLLIPILGVTQILDTLIDNRFSESLETAPLLLKKGDKVRIESENPVYLFNIHRFTLCKELANDSDCEIQFDALLRNFKESIAERDRMMKSLEAINDSTQAQAKKLIEVYEVNLKETRQTLIGTQHSLTNANNSLKDALENIKNVRQENFMKKFWMGAGCVGSGLIIGLLLSR